VVRGGLVGVGGLTAFAIACGSNNNNNKAGKAAAARAAGNLAASGSPTPLPPPETKTIRLGLAPCDAPLMISERYLQDEGFTDIQFQAAGGVAQLTDGNADLAVTFPPWLTSAAEGGKAVIAIGPVHPGCLEFWAPQSVATLKDVRGHTVVVKSKTPDDGTYPFYAMALKNAGVDPSEVNFVVDPAADLTQLFLDGKSDLVQLGTTGLVAFKTNSASKGHAVFDQAMEPPWSQQACCILATTTDWLRANPAGAKRALRAIYRAADSLPKDRADA